MPPKIELLTDEIRQMEPPKSLGEDLKRKMGELINLTPEQKNRLKKFIKSSISDWESDTSELHQRLLEDNDLTEGVVMETDFPYEGSSNVHVPVTEIYMEIYKSVFKRSILGAGSIWYAETDEDALQDVLADVEGLMNYMARNKWNIEESIENVFWTTQRDGLGIMQIVWSEEYKWKNDIVLVTNTEDFLQEFPSAEEIGMEESEYKEALEFVAKNASEEFPIEIPIRFEKQVYNGCKAEIVELINFVTIPATVNDIKDPLCRGYGKRYQARGEELRQKSKDGIFYEDAVRKVLSKNNASASVTAYMSAQDEIEGLSRTNRKDTYDLYELVIRGRLDGEEGVEEEFLMTWDKSKNEILQCIYYPYRVDYYALFKINSRPNRMIGRSIPQKTRDLNDEIDTQHNQRINTRTIGTVPSFKALNSKKRELDPMLRETRWRPGVIFWLTDFDAFEQFKVQPTDLGESLSEEANDLNILDLFLGSASSLLSGQAPSGDPSAPGNKTALLIQQSNLRMDDPLMELRRGIQDVGEICLSHLYQFGPPEIEFRIESASGDQRALLSKTIHKKYLRKGINLHMRGVTVTQNPDAEMARGFQLYQFLINEPTFAQNTPSRIQVLSDALRAGRVRGREKYVLSAEEAQQFQVETQKEALRQLEAERAQAEADAQKQRLQAARQDLGIRRTAEQLAERNLTQNGAPEAQ